MGARPVGRKKTLTKLPPGGGKRPVCFWCGEAFKNKQALRAHFGHCDKRKEWKEDPDLYESLHGEEMQANYEKCRKRYNDPYYQDREREKMQRKRREIGLDPIPPRKRKHRRDNEKFRLL
jgi:hypothetical protein